MDELITSTMASFLPIRDVFRWFGWYTKITDCHADNVTSLSHCNFPSVSSPCIHVFHLSCPCLVTSKGQRLPVCSVFAQCQHNRFLDYDSGFFDNINNNRTD